MDGNYLFNIIYSKENMIKIYNENLKFKRTVGIDKINNRLFESNKDKYIDDIYRKIHNETYKFTPYKEKLFLKDHKSPPRQISIPTIRDSITLTLLKEIINCTFSNNLKHKLVQTHVANVYKSMNSGLFNYFIKIDIKNYYGSIKHDIMMNSLKKNMSHKPTLNLIWRAIRTPTVEVSSNRKSRNNNTKGLPQGIPISNILSTIYLSNLDNKYYHKDHLEYYRYVDDILILCNEKDSYSIRNSIISELKSNYHLCENTKKRNYDYISNGVEYLGYNIKPNSINVKDSNIIKLKNNIEDLFIEYSYLKKKNLENIDFFTWKLNLKITGSIFRNNKYGWLFFFSQITEDNEYQFHILDHFIGKMLDKYNINANLKIKKFVRTYKEIKYNLHNTRYIPNFDNYTFEKKKDFLINIVKIKNNISDEMIEDKFFDYIYSEIQSIEKDTQGFS